MGTVSSSKSYDEPTSRRVNVKGPTITCSMASLASTFAERRSTAASFSRPVQYFLKVRTASTSMPKSAMAAIALWATESVTPGLGKTWIRRSHNREAAVAG